MRRTRRITALFASLLLANLTWVGSGYACAMPAMAHPSQASSASNGATDAEMPGMDMSAAAATPSGGSHHEQPCRLPWVPEGCQSMAPCAPAVFASHAFTLDVPNVTPVAIADLHVLEPPSEMAAPDLPPPRA